MEWAELERLQEDLAGEAEAVVAAHGAIAGRTIFLTDAALLQSAGGEHVRVRGGAFEGPVAMVVPVGMPDAQLVGLLADTEPTPERRRLLGEAVRTAEADGSWSVLVECLARLTGGDRAGLVAEALHRIGGRVPCIATLSIFGGTTTSGEGQRGGGEAAVVVLETQERQRTVYVLPGADGVTRRVADSAAGDVLRGRFSGFVRPLKAFVRATALN